MRAWLTILVLCTFAGAYIVSIGDYVILSFSFSKDQNITFFKKQNKDTLQDENNNQSYEVHYFGTWTQTGGLLCFLLGHGHCLVVPLHWMAGLPPSSVIPDDRPRHCLNSKGACIPQKQVVLVRHASQIQKSRISSPQRHVLENWPASYSRLKSDAFNFNQR